MDDHALANCTLERQKDKLADELSVSQSEVADLKRTVSQLMTASSDVDAVRGSTEVPLVSVSSTSITQRGMFVAWVSFL